MWRKREGSSRAIRYAPARSALAAETGIAVFETNPPVVERSDVLVLAVKPQAMPQLLAEIRPLVGPGHLVISIAAGVSIATLSEGLGGDRTAGPGDAQHPGAAGGGGLGLCARTGSRGG